jgi:hypothetical protein
MVAPFEIATLTDGTFEIRNANGQVVLPDLENQEYLVFLRWNSIQPIPNRQICAFTNIHFFNNVPDVVEHFKRSGLLIYTDRDKLSDRDKHVSLETRIAVSGKQSFCLIMQAAPTPRHPEYVLTGFSATETSGFAAQSSRVAVTLTAYHALNEHLKDEESDVRRVSSWTIERSFVYLDVSDFSKMPAGHQVLVINSIVHAVRTDKYWEMPVARETRQDIKAQMCIGDGYIFVLKDPLKATFFAAYLANLIEILIATNKLPIDFHFRMGAHIGNVYSFYDPGRENWNYIGDGINGGNRVLAAVGKDTDDVVFISAQLRQKILAGQRPAHFPDLVGDAYNRGRRADKHGNPWRVYEINHSKLMAYLNEDILQKGRKDRQRAEQDGPIGLP